MFYFDWQAINGFLSTQNGNSIGINMQNERNDSKKMKRHTTTKQHTAKQ